MTIRQLYDLNKNRKDCNNDLKDMDCCKGGLFIDFIINDSTTGKYPFCETYEIIQNKIVSSKTNEEHAEIWSRDVKSYILETDYQDWDLIRVRIEL